jgi:hypothetical protein
MKGNYTMTEKKIESLTQEQLDMIPEHNKEWIAIGRATGRADRSIVESAACDAYKVAGLEAPKSFMWFDSPYAASVYIKENIEKDSNISNIYNNAIYGQHDANLLAFYDYFDKISNGTIGNISNLHPMMKIAKQCGWWWAYDEMAIFSERPSELHSDAAGRLHCEDGMALKYFDGWGLYSWHGYTIPRDKEWIITNKEKLNPTVIEKEKNAELRRIMLEIYGFTKYLEERTYKVISEDTDGAGNPRRLLEIKVGNEKVRIVEVDNSSLEPDGTRRKFHLGAMPGNNPHEAIAASFGFNPEVFKEEACS